MAKHPNPGNFANRKDDARKAGMKSRRGPSKKR